MSDLFKRKRRKYDKGALNNITVGLVELCAGAGATQLSVMLGMYFSNALHLKTAIVSIGIDDTFSWMKTSLKTGAVRCKEGNKYGFSYKCIDFYSSVRDGFIHVIESNYDVVIIKINLATIENNMAENLVSVMVCKYRIFVGSLLPWKYKACLKRIEFMRKIYPEEHWIFATLSFQKEWARALEREQNISVRIIPFVENPFNMKGDVLIKLQQIVT